MRLLFPLIIIEYFKLCLNQTLTSNFINIGGALFLKVLINSEFNLYLFHIDIQKNYSNWYHIPILFALDRDYILLCQRGISAKIMVYKEFLL